MKKPTIKTRQAERGWISIPIQNRRGIPIRLRCNKCGHESLAVIAIAVDLLSKAWKSLEINP